MIFKLYEPKFIFNYILFDNLHDLKQHYYFKYKNFNLFVYMNFKYITNLLVHIITLLIKNKNK